MHGNSGSCCSSLEFLTKTLLEDAEIGQMDDFFLYLAAF